MPQVIPHPRMRPGYEHGYEDGRRCLGGGGDFLFLSIRLALRAVRHDAAVIRGFRDQFTGHGLDPGPVLLRIFAIQPCCWHCDGPVGTEECPPHRRGRSWRGGAAVRHGPQRFGERRQNTPGSWGCICTCGSHLHRHQELSGVAGRYFDRRYPDVRNGGRIGRAVCRWANDRRRNRLEPFLDLDGRYRFGDGCPSLCSPTRRKEN